MALALLERFEKYDDEFLDFSKVKSPVSTRPDLCAFLILDTLCSSHQDIIAGAEHDEIYLGIDCEALQTKITDEQIRDLVRCGVSFNEALDSLVLHI